MITLNQDDMDVLCHGTRSAKMAFYLRKYADLIEREEGKEEDSRYHISLSFRCGNASITQYDDAIVDFAGFPKITTIEIRERDG